MYILLLFCTSELIASFDTKTDTVKLDLWQAYERHVEEVTGSDEDSTRSESYVACKELGDRLAGTFFGFQRKEFRPSILGIVEGGIDFAFSDAPKKISFLEVGILPFSQKLSAGDTKDM